MDRIELIKSLINEKGVNKTKIAERCGVNPATLSRILSGKITYVADKRLQRIIEFLKKVNTNEV